MPTKRGCNGGSGLDNAHLGQCRTFSYVDNISIVGANPSIIASGFVALQTFMELWGLSLDSKKTYIWATNKTMRDEMGTMGFQTVADVVDLGGTLSFGRAYRNRKLLARGEGLEDRWSRLKRSRAPLRLKLVALPMVFWSKILHGSNGCPVPNNFLQKLRTQAMKSLGIQTAGASSLIRLSTSKPSTVDPGFFHLLHTVMDFRRLCTKAPSLLDFWTLFHSTYDGSILPGPCTRLVTLLGSVGWSVVNPPWCTDHDGLLVDLLACDKGTLQELLSDAWIQWVARQVTHRKGLVDLDGLNLAFVQLDWDNLTPIELARVQSLQEGAFLSGWKPSSTIPNKLYVNAAWNRTLMYIGYHAPDSNMKDVIALKLRTGRQCCPNRSHITCCLQDRHMPRNWKATWPKSPLEFSFFLPRAKESNSFLLTAAVFAMALVASAPRHGPWWTPLLGRSLQRPT